MSDWFPTESYPPDEFGSSQELTSETDVPLREGLPPGYRMRHDRHYVDEFDSRSPAALVRMLPARDISARMPVTLASADSLVESVRRVGILQPLLVRRREIGYELIADARRFAAAAAAGLTELPCRVYNVDEDEARLLAEADDVRQSLPIAERVREPKETQPSLAAALAEISRSLGAVGTVWDLSSEGPPRPYTRTVRDVTRAEVQRATWLVEGLRVLESSPEVSPVRMTLDNALDRVARLTCSEREGAEVAPVIEANGREAQVRR